jgi:glycosyltransferase involved in cell wall biosynthesis
MSGPLLLDLSHTSHTRARTGIQRVARSLQAALGSRAVAVTHDPWQGAWRELETWEQANLAADTPAVKRGARWPLAVRWRGRWRRFVGAPPSLPTAAGLIVPEVFSPAVARALPELFAATAGPRVAIFHDAIPLTHPQFTPAKTVTRFPDYFAELAAFDGIAAVSAASRGALLAHWEAQGRRDVPPVQTIPLGVSPVSAPARVAAPSEAPVVLSVGSIEGRKNHVALLDACEQLWQRGAVFTLRLVGLANLETGSAALQRIEALRAAGRPVRFDGPVSEPVLAQAYADCAFTVYPSLVEGFGLPVIESLVHGKPCICSGEGALGESARDGGCVMLTSVDRDSLAAAISGLIDDDARRETLAAAARARRFRDWKAYADELTTWMQTLVRQTAPAARN